MEDLHKYSYSAAAGLDVTSVSISFRSVVAKATDYRKIDKFLGFTSMSI